VAEAVAAGVEPGNAMKQYRAIGLGGTFDHFHIGHQRFLEYAAEFADHLVVGITTPELTAHKLLAQSIESFETRKQAVESFLTAKGISGETFSLNDQFGPTLKDSQVEAVAVTEHTVTGGEAINQERTKLGLSPLPVHISTLVRDEHGDVISSTRIRLGEINRTGQLYKDLLQNGVTLTEAQTAFFKQPQGKLLSDVPKITVSVPIATVGDVVSESFLQAKVDVSLVVFDRKSARQAYTSSVLTEPTQTLFNPAGRISTELSDWLRQFCQQLSHEWLPRTQFLYIEGEEDLATVALVLLAPLQLRVYYGQPNQGIVELIIDEALKERFANVFRTP